MQNTFSQSGNDSKWFLTKIIFQNRYVALETPSRPPPFMANAILNFHFDFLNPSLTVKTSFQVSLFCPVSTLKSPKGTEFEEYLSNVLRCIIMLYSRMSRCYSNYCNSLCFIFGALPFKYA